MTGQTLGTLRNNYGDAYGHFVGMSFMTSVQDVLVYELGRFVAPGNSENHIVKLVNAATGLDVPGGSVTLSLAGTTPGQYVYGYLANPVQLSGLTSYYLLSQETAGGDQWYDFGPVVTGGLGVANWPVYQSDSGSYVVVMRNLATASYGPLNFGARPVLVGGLSTVNFVNNGPGPFSGTAAFGLNVTTYNVPVYSVKTQVDGQPYGSVTFNSGSGLYSVSVDTTQLTNGQHTLTATAIDLSGNQGTANLSFTVGNIPTTGTA